MTIIAIGGGIGAIDLVGAYVYKKKRVNYKNYYHLVELGGGIGMTLTLKTNLRVSLRSGSDNILMGG